MPVESPLLTTPAGLPPIGIGEDAAAKFLDLSKSTMYRLRKSGKIPFVRATDSKILYRIETLNRWLQSQETTEQPTCNQAGNNAAHEANALPGKGGERFKKELECQNHIYHD